MCVNATGGLCSSKTVEHSPSAGVKGLTVWQKDEWGVTPIALTNGVEYGERANTAGEDTIFTLVQEIKQ